LQVYQSLDKYTKQGEKYEEADFDPRSHVVSIVSPVILFNCVGGERQPTSGSYS
jgi:hypothetical protein